MRRYVISKHISEHKTAAEFMAHVKSLAIEPDTLPGSKLVSDMKVTQGEDGTIRLYCTRASKQLTLDEVALLEQEYSLIDLATLLTKRGYVLTNQNGEQTNAKPKRTASRRPRKTRAEENAHLDTDTGTHASGDKLF